MQQLMRRSCGGTMWPLTTKPDAYCLLSDERLLNGCRVQCTESKPVQPRYDSCRSRRNLMMQQTRQLMGMRRHLMRRSCGGKRLWTGRPRLFMWPLNTKLGKTTCIFWLLTNEWFKLQPIKTCATTFDSCRNRSNLMTQKPRQLVGMRRQLMRRSCWGRRLWTRRPRLFMWPLNTKLGKTTSIAFLVC